MLLAQTVPISSQKVLVEEIFDTREKMVPSIASIDAMIAIRVGLHVELIVILYKCLS